MSDIYDKQDNRITLEEFGKHLADDFNYKVIKQTHLPNGFWVSTVWLGLNHSFSGDIPLIFETMVFEESTGSRDYACKRYSTLEEAELGHEVMCAEWALAPMPIEDSKISLSIEEAIEDKLPFQTRSEENGLVFFSSLKEAFEHAEKDSSVWKISFTVGNDRVRLIKKAIDMYGESEWVYEPIKI